MISNLQTVFKKNFSSVLPLAFRYIFFLIIGVCQIYLFTHFVDKQQYGQFQYIITIFSTLSIFALPGTTMAFTKMGALNDEQLHFKLVKLRIKSSIIGSIVILALSSYFYDSNPELSKSFIWLIFLFPFFFSLDSYLHIFSGRENFSLKASLEVLKKLLVISSLGVAIYFQLLDNLPLLMLMLLLPEIICHIIGYSILFSMKKPKIASQNDYQYYKRYTQGITFISFLGIIETKLDKLIIGTFIGLSELAIFHVSKVIQEQIKSIWSIFSTVFLPKIYKRTKKESFKLTIIVVPFIGLFFFIVIGAILYFLDDIVLLWFGSNYLSSIPITRIMLYTSFVNILHTVVATYMVAQNMITELTKVRTITIVFYVLSLVILTPQYQVYGIVYSWVIKTLLASLLGFVIFVRHGIREKFFSWQDTAK